MFAYEILSTCSATDMCCNLYLTHALTIEGNQQTTAGKGVKGFGGFMEYAEKMSPLGNATAEECANYTVSLFSDLTKKVTLQNLFHDGGFSNVGVSQEIIDSIPKE